MLEILRCESLQVIWFPSGKYALFMFELPECLEDLPQRFDEIKSEFVGKTCSLKWVNMRALIGDREPKIRSTVPFSNFVTRLTSKRVFRDSFMRLFG